MRAAGGAQVPWGIAKARYDRSGRAREVPEELLDLVLAERMQAPVSSLRAMDADDVDRQVGYWMGSDVAEAGNHTGRQQDPRSAGPG